jgi:peptidoglycan-associated lipoprotein
MEMVRIKMNKLFMVLFAMLFVISACSKKQVEQSAGTEEASASVSDSYGPGGSDYQQAGALSTVNFQYDKATLTSSAKKILNQNADWLKTNENIFVQIEGHCDSRGTIEYNLALGERRAVTVKNYLSKLGVDSKRLSTISYGEERPIAMDENESAWGRNRRANFVVISK